MPVRQKLTEKLVRTAETRAKDYHLFDAEVLGLALCVYRSGNRAFTLSYRSSGRQRRYTIGRWPDWTVTAARERAKELRRDIEAGGDPMARREDQRAQPTVGDLIQRYIEEHVPRLAPRNGSDQVSMLRKLVEPIWKARLVSEITPMDVDHLLTQIAEGRTRPAKKDRTKERQRVKATPVRANRVGEVLRKMFNLSIKWHMRPDNPAQDFRRRPEVEREVFLSPDEIARLASALERAEDQRQADAVRLALLTGARFGEVRQARFEQFNLDVLTWAKQAATTKQRKIHRLPISEETAALIRRRRLIVGADCPWLFPGDREGQPLQDMRRFWAAIQTEAELPDVRIHDLRHTFASLLVSGGASLEMIGKLLGHTQAKTTMRYAHLMDSPLRAGVNSVADMVKPRLRVVGGEG